jgi:hypothetical protein
MEKVERERKRSRSHILAIQISIFMSINLSGKIKFNISDLKLSSWKKIDFSSRYFYLV